MIEYEFKTTRKVTNNSRKITKSKLATNNEIMMQE
jgi:hypothetical protein